MKRKRTIEDLPALQDPRPALLSIRGLAGCDEDGEDIELVTGAQYSFHGTDADFEYQESELTGMDGTRTRISVKPDEVIVSRTGTVNMHMLFNRDKKHYFSYDTPFGSLSVSVTTRSIKNELTAEGGHLEILYSMDFDSRAVTKNKLEMQVKL